MSPTIIDDTFQVSATSKVMGWILLFIGVFLAGLGIYIVLNATAMAHALVGFGILLSASGGLILTKKSTFSIQLQEEAGHVLIKETSGDKEVPLSIPLDYYSTIVVMSDLKNSSNNQGYEVALMNSMGASLLIKTFPEKRAALNFGQSLQQFLGIDLVVDKIPFGSGLEGKTREMNIRMPEKTKLKEFRNDGTTIFSWKSNGSVMNLVLLLLMIYGPFHAVVFAIIPLLTSRIALYIIAGLGALFSVMLLAIILSNLFRQSYLSLTGEQIAYYYTLLGKKFGEKHISREDIGIIKNSIIGGNGLLTIISKAGVQSINRLAVSLSGGKKSLDFSLLSDLMKLKNEMIDMNVTSLNAVEKFYLEKNIFFGE